VFVLEVSTETDLLPILLARLFDFDVEESDIDLGHLEHDECETREEEGSKI
jgi:hypothetical protein